MNKVAVNIQKISIAEQLNLQFQQLPVVKNFQLLFIFMVRKIGSSFQSQKFQPLNSYLGNGGQGNTKTFGRFLGDKCIIVAPDGYQRSW